MEIRWIEAFLAVAEELHFGRAAERIHMAQSPLSQTVRKLERQLGTPLFERNTRSVTLTSAGHAFLPHARRVVAEMDLARRATRHAGDTVYGKVALSFSGAINHLTLPRLTRGVQRAHPDIQLELTGGVFTGQALHLLGQGRLDIALVGLPASAPATATRPITVERLGAVLPPDHPLAREGGAVDPAALRDEPFVMVPGAPGSAYRESVVSTCLRAGFTPRVAQEVQDPYLILSLVAAGAGITLAPSCLAAITPSGAVWVPLTDPAASLRSGLAWRPDRLSDAARAVLAVADEVLPEPGT